MKLDRVVINASGEATTPSVAQREHGITPTIIFVRDDGWSLGAPAAFEEVARSLWRNEWVKEIRLERGIK